MIQNKKQAKVNSIPVQFEDEDPHSEIDAIEQDKEPIDNSEPLSEIETDSQDEGVEEGQLDSDTSIGKADGSAVAEFAESDSSAGQVIENAEDFEGLDGIERADSEPTAAEEGASSQGNKPTAGPMLAELIATRAELRRIETERNDLLERLARRQADFENYRKRVERERGETFHRLVGDVVSKLLPVMDNMRRALQAESILEKNESAEFRHFLRGVELIYKQLNDALQELGVEPVPAVGQPFDPHVHEAVATEHSDEYEPDTVTQELLRGYRLGDKLLRPAMVKVSTRQ